VRADVADNGFAFVVPRSRTLRPRYVVWTGGDGTPHVQPVPVLPGFVRSACGRRPANLAEVSPGFTLGCVEWAVRPRRPRRPVVRCPSPVPAVPVPAPPPAPRPRTP